MSQRKELGRRRVADSDDDDDDHTNAPAPQAVAAAAAAATPVDAPAARAPRAKAAAAATFVDPTAAAAAAPAPARAKAPSAATTATAAAPAAPAAATKDAVKAVLDADYQTLTLDGLLALLAACDKKRIDEVKTEREAARQQAQQLRQNNRIERFFDTAASPTAEDSGKAAASPAVTAGAAFPCTELNFQGKGYRYEYMLTYIHNTLTRNHKGANLNQRNQLPAPQIEMIGKKKTIITNFGRLCEVFHRTPEEVKEFIEQELSANGNLDSKQALILKYQARKANDFDKLFIRYLDEYVKCNACHQIDTVLTKENRILTLHCNSCTATRTVNVSHDNTYTASTEKRSIKRNAITL